ncbi:MAG: hypothetical protein GX281_03695 [Bacteroidales bacterium]|jgi:regulator of sirC expression with transglutaminase-like and TPR domain|nr:transglutaminase family protein [Bacteroidales bacterium]NLK79804.1 hypothetical protein [Bacteroidales bacterium]HPX79914.1 transglutaminase family protein [Bacteroidales bacterium]HQB23315.1 transglutaminase family protein [Bacteroidales bacterium]
MVYDKEILDLLPLLDDPDTYVQEALYTHLIAMGTPALEQLESIRKEGGMEEGVYAIEKMIETLREGLKFEKLEQWIAHPEEDLLAGLCLIQDILTEDVDLQSLREIMMECVTEVLLEIRDDQTIMENVKLFNHVFFNRLHFFTIDPMFSQPKNTFIHEVLNKRKGSPVAVGFIYLMLAYQTGVRIGGRLFKGGFLPAVLDRDGNVLFYVNVFKNGLLFPHRELEVFLKDMNLQIPVESFRDAQPEDLAQIYAETLLFSFSALEKESYANEISKLTRILALFGRENTMLIEMDDDEE